MYICTSYREFIPKNRQWVYRKFTTTFKNELLNGVGKHYAYLSCITDSKFSLLKKNKQTNKKAKHCLNSCLSHRSL